MPSFLGPFTFEDSGFDAILKKMNLESKEITFSTQSGFLNLGEILQVNSIVVGVAIRVLVPFDSNPALSIGDTLDQNRFLSNDYLDLTETGILESLTFDLVLNITQSRIYWNATSSTVGNAVVYLLTARP